MEKIIRHINDHIQGKLHGKKRSSHWHTDRKGHLEKYPNCVVCWGTVKVEVHHKKSFHEFPELERDPNNWVTLCEAKKKGINCHLFFGHLGSFRNINPNIDSDVEYWAPRLRKIL